MNIVFDAPALASLGAVIVIDIVLSGDNAIVLGLAASGLEPEARGRVIAYGVAIATLLRVALAFVAVPLLAIVGLTLAGGLLLLWVAWKIWREARHAMTTKRPDATQAATASARPAPKTLRQAVVQVAIADLSLSLDNVLAVAGAAHEHPWVLAIGLALSIALMAFAARLIARYLGRYPWLVYVGLAVVALVAIKMIYDGTAQVIAHWGGA
jgi:YjbE family integral membrane protein